MLEGVFEVLVDDGLATAFKDAQLSRKFTCTPDPSASMPLCSCPPANVVFDEVRTPVYARRSQRSDKKFPLLSCPPKTYCSAKLSRRQSTDNANGLQGYLKKMSGRSLQAPLEKKWHLHLAAGMGLEERSLDRLKE